MNQSKHEWRKDEKSLYLPKQTPQYIEIPKQTFITLSGQGNPNTETFGIQIEALYTFAYTLKMLPRKGHIIPNYYDYTVYPLEGIWDLSLEGRKKDYLDKNDFVYTIMIRQPDFITPEIFQMAKDQITIAKANPYLHEVELKPIDDGPSVQMLHVGPYDTEPLSFIKMEAYIKEQGLYRTTKIHREIYLSDARKTKPESMKTVLRCFVGKEI